MFMLPYRGGYRGGSLNCLMSMIITQITCYGFHTQQVSNQLNSYVGFESMY